MKTFLILVVILAGNYDQRYNSSIIYFYNIFVLSLWTNFECSSRQKIFVGYFIWNLFSKSKNNSKPVYFFTNQLFSCINQGETLQCIIQCMQGNPDWTAYGFFDNAAQLAT